MHATSALTEADRLMTVCNSCRYCEGLCAVFPAMEMRTTFTSGDLNYLANLCHGCGACYYDCQFSPPHEFNVNVPQNLAVVRNDSYRQYAWPPQLAGLFERNGLAISLIAALSVAAFIIGFVAFNDPAVLFGTHTGEGSFYRVMPHYWMAGIFGAAFLYAFLAMGMSVRAFWRDIGARQEPAATRQTLWQAMRDTGELRYLDGGGVGCYNEDERPQDRRRLYHHATFYGFLLCVASTSTASVYHYLGWGAPYAWHDLPVIFGTVGGIGLLIGPLGLLAQKRQRDPAMMDLSRAGMDVAFILMLFLTSLTGLALLVLRATPAMGILLALHLGVVFGFFITMPYGKFMHGIYRFAALVRYAYERRRLGAPAPARPAPLSPELPPVGMRP
jgi:citrate/tricarballylate utilization protein